MSTATRVVFGLLVISGVAFAGPQVVAAQALTGSSDLANMGTVQELSIANDAHYAPSLDSLVDGQFGQSVNFRKNSKIAYMVNADRTHYLAATSLPSGEVVVRSDETRPVTCADYTAECVAQVTADAELLAASPHWVSF